jgi:hypothetical protein
VVGEYVDANGKRRYISGKTVVRQKLRRLLADRDEGIAYDSDLVRMRSCGYGRRSKNRIGRARS